MTSEIPPTPLELSPPSTVAFVHKDGLLFRAFFALHWVSVLAVAGSFLGAVILFVIGGIRSITAAIIAWYFIADIPIAGLDSDFPSDRLVTTQLISAVDAFLFALALMIFSYGVYHLFLSNGKEEEALRLPRWLKVDSINDLKTSLAQIIIILLFVEFLERVILAGSDVLSWESLVLPGAVLLLAGALKLMRSSH